MASRSGPLRIPVPRPSQTIELHFQLCPTVIVHLDADAFFASVEQAADLRLRGRPVAVGGDRRGVVASASYEARIHGIGAAMPTSQARRLCPNLIVIPGDFEKYELFSRLIFEYARDFTPIVEQTSIDEGYFDLGPNRGSDALEVAERIRRAIRQSLKVGVSEGIASNKLVSQIASKLRKPDALVRVNPGEERAFLAPLPNRWLPGVGPRLATSLDAAGLRSIGQIAEIPPEQLMLFAGQNAPVLHRFSQGIDERPVLTERAAAKSFSRQHTFPEDVTDAEFITATLRSMADGLFARVREEHLAIRTVSLKIRYNDMQDVLRSESLQEPTDLEGDVYALLVRLLKACWSRRVSLRAVSLRLSNVYKGLALSLPLDQESRTRECRSKAAALMDQLRRGGTQLMRGHDLWLKRVGEEPRPELPRAAARARSQLREATAPAVVLPKRGKACAADFVPLNLRSHFSFLDSLLSPEAAVELALNQGYCSAALCDPNLHGLVPFLQTAKARGLRPVVGAELRVEGGTLLCYAQNATGYAHLCALLSQALPSRGLSRAAFDVLSDGLLTLLPNEACPPVRLASPTQRMQLDIVRSIRTLTLLNEAHPDKPKGAFLLPSKEQIEAMDPQAVRKTREIAEACSGAPVLGKLFFPAYAPADGATAHAMLRRLVFEGFHRHYGSARPEVAAQLEEELAIIAEVGYEEYFLTVWDLLEACRVRGIPWITRGSAGDSLVCRCLGISDFCPVRFELYFRRFLNRDRMALNKLPDIDLDFPHDRKDEVVDLIFARFGTTHAAVVGGFGTFRPRSAVAEILKVLGLSEGQVRRFTDHFPWTGFRDLPTLLRESPQCHGLPLSEEPYKTALSLAAFLDGVPRHPKMHPCGVVISRIPIHSVTPTFQSSKGYPTTHFDMDACESAGLVKMDILAQGGLAVLRDTRQALLRDGHPVPPLGDASWAPWEDRRIWSLISRGEARGVHHIESPAMISLSRMCAADSIDKLVAIVSVIRPGAANNLKKLSFARRCQGLEEVEYAHPSLAGVLRSTFGVVAYEEHILQICEAFAGLPPGRADVLRRALVKERMQEVEVIGLEFIACARSLGRTEEEIRVVWELVAGFHGYAFCRAHSTAYALEAYEAAWFKDRHPAYFLAAVLSNGKGFYSPLAYTLEARRLGIDFLRPDINDPCDAFHVECSGGRESIRVPLRAITGLSSKTLEAIRVERPFASLDDFIHRVPAEFQEIQALIRLGAFDGFGRKRAAQYWEACSLVMEAGSGASLGLELVALPPAERLAETSARERLDAEWDLLGFTVTDHPLARWPDIDWSRYRPVQSLAAFLDQEVLVCGLVIDHRLHDQADERLIMFVLISDRSGMLECELFADVYARFGSVIARHPVLALRGIVTPFDNRQGWTLRVTWAAAPS